MVGVLEKEITIGKKQYEIRSANLHVRIKKILSASFLLHSSTIDVETIVSEIS